MNAVLAISMLASYAAVNPSEATLEPFERPAVLEGASAAASVPVEIPANLDEGANIRIEVRWSASEVIDAARSTLSVEVDGRPIRSVWLRELMTGASPKSLIVELESLEPGTHALGVRARLVVDGDPCLERYKDDAWLIVSEQTRVELVKSEREAKPRAGLATLPQRWRAAGPEVQLVPPRTRQDDDALLAALEVSDMLRSWGLVPRLAEVEEGRSRLELWTLREAEADGHPLAAALVATPGATAIAGLDDRGDLTIIGRKGRDLARAARQLKSERLRSLCPQSGPCMLTESASASPSEMPSAAATQVLSLAELGFERGWTARGPGRQLLRWVWTPPSDWSIENKPQLRLKAARSTHPQLDDERSSVTVELAGRPLASWSLSSLDAEDTMAVTIPADAWGEPQWVLDVVTVLHPRDDTPCASVDDEAVWISLSPDSGLVVERTETAYDGFAAFERTARSMRPALVRPTEWTWDEALALSAVLWPLSTSTPAAAWEWAAPVGERNGLSIELRAASAKNLGALQELEDHWWGDKSTSLGVPLLASDSTVLLVHTRDPHSDGQLVSVGVGLDYDAAEFTPPNFTQMTGHHAVWLDGHWVGLGGGAAVLDVRTVREPAAATSGQTPATSDQARAFRRLNAGWIVGSVLALGALLVWTRRRRPPASTRAEDLEVMPDGGLS